MPTSPSLAGLPMRMAISSYITGPSSDLARQFLALEGYGDGGNLRELRQGVWSAIALRAVRNELRVTGLLQGNEDRMVIDQGLLVNSTPDFQTNRLTTDIGIFVGVPVSEITPASQRADESRTTVGPRTSQCRPSKKACDEWYQARVKDWADDKRSSSENGDWEAARSTPGLEHYS